MANTVVEIEMEIVTKRRGRILVVNGETMGVRVESAEEQVTAVGVVQKLSPAETLMKVLRFE